MNDQEKVSTRETSFDEDILRGGSNKDVVRRQGYTLSYKTIFTGGIIILFSRRKSRWNTKKLSCCSKKWHSVEWYVCYMDCRAISCSSRVPYYTGVKPGIDHFVEFTSTESKGRNSCVEERRLGPFWSLDTDSSRWMEICACMNECMGTTVRAARDTVLTVMVNLVKCNDNVSRYLRSCQIFNLERSRILRVLDLQRSWIIDFSIMDRRS